MSQPRPVNLDITTFKFPITAIASILHRISGVLIFLVLPFFIYFWEQSLISEASFTNLVSSDLRKPHWQLLMFVGCSSFTYHAIAGVRHLLMDLGIGESKCAGKLTASLVLIISAVSVAFWGVILW